MHKGTRDWSLMRGKEKQEEEKNRRFQKVELEENVTRITKKEGVKHGGREAMYSNCEMERERKQEETREGAVKPHFPEDPLVRLQ